MSLISDGIPKTPILGQVQNKNTLTFWQTGRPNPSASRMNHSTEQVRGAALQFGQRAGGAALGAADPPRPVAPRHGAALPSGRLAASRRRRGRGRHLGRPPLVAQPRHQHLPRRRPAPPVHLQVTTAVAS